MRSLYCTADKIGISSGGGIVTENELQALREVSDEVFCISRDDIDPPKYYQPSSPFLEDYFTLQLVKDKHFDLAHFYSGCFTQTISWLKSRGTKVSYTVAAHDRRLTIEEFEKLGLEYPWMHIKDDSLWDIYTEGIRRADVVICPSTLSAQVCELQIGTDGTAMVIPHGCHVPQKAEPGPEQFRVGYLGAYGPDKGVIYLIKAWDALNLPDAVLVLAGSGSEVLEPFICQVANRGSYALLGRVKSVSDFYNQCSVYCQPSVCEGFGIEVLEAMVHGRPVIASEGAGVSELVEDGMGFRVPIRSPKAIAQRIKWFYHHWQEIPQMGIKAHQTAEDYSWEKIRRRYSELFTSLYSGSKGAGSRRRR